MQRFSFQNVLDADAINLSITGMLIVFAALTFISLFIAGLPKLLNALSDYLPAEHTHHVGHAAGNADEADDEESLIAALGYVMHKELHKH